MCRISGRPATAAAIIRRLMKLCQARTIQGAAMTPAMAARSKAPPIVSLRSDPPIAMPSGKPTTGDEERDRPPRGGQGGGGARGLASIEGRIRGHGVRPRIPSTLGAVRAAAGASKNGIAVTPAIPAMIEPGKIWMALFS